MKIFENSMACTGVLFMLLSALSCKDNSITPSGAPPNLILNSSFETSDTPSYQGWQFWSNVQSSPTFSGDVPPSGGKWSILLAVGDRIVAKLQTKVAAPVGNNRYKLSVWAKSKYDPGHALLILNKAIRKTIVVQDSIWRYYEITDSLVTVQGDSLVVSLDAGSTYFGTQSFFDLCRLEIVK